MTFVVVGFDTIAAWYAVASVVSFGLHAWDKSAARLRASRIPEAALLGIDALGGWPGGVAARTLLRHKTAKSTFQFRAGMTIVLNLLSLGWFA